MSDNTDNKAYDRIGQKAQHFWHGINVFCGVQVNWFVWKILVLYYWWRMYICEYVECIISFKTVQKERKTV